MIKIALTTRIKASKQTVFDLSRNIDIHEQSMQDSNEKAVGGVTSGLINEGETVTFKGKHFGFTLSHQSLITEMRLYDSFTDVMQKGQFKSFQHEHLYREENGQTLMVDHIQYEVPFGIFGTLFNRLILKKYLTRMIEKRNAFIKNLAEQHH
ncbi:SRPBCC family protein [Flavobacterium sp.]|uniref:SRPBCC family protein n=1 Tax=Flavobacterium sp. TaxID=239 RepID=UPI0028BD89ED|nr:SRPBCC family protein [Flavobacterium sp.]